MTETGELPVAWFHVDMDGLDAIHRAHGRRWHGGAGFYTSAVERSLQFFERRRIRATYFVIGQDTCDPAKLNALRSIVGAGHRVASHSLSHRFLHEITTDAERRREIVDSRSMIEQSLGVPCSGFRAPGYSIDHASLELVREAGYLYDSSVFPTYPFRSRLNSERLMADPFEIYPGAGFFEIPLPRSGWGMPPFHPSYSMLLGAGHFRRGLRAHRRRSRYLTLLFHLTEFADRQRLGADPTMWLFTLNGYSERSKRGFLDRLMETVAGTYAFTTTEEFLAEWPASAPDLNPRTVLGISTTHETGACVVRDGVVLSAISEERLSRKKLDTHFPPAASIREAIRVAGIEPSSIDAVAVAGLHAEDLLPRTLEGLRKDVSDFHSINDYVPHAARIMYRLFYFWRAIGYKRVLDVLERDYGIRPRLHFVEHHEAHAASAYRTGTAQDALIITADGVGDDVCLTFSVGKAGFIRRLATFFYPHSFGQFYTACTQVLGFKGGRHEGKITGLAGFGVRVPELVEKVERTLLVADGGFRLHKKYYAEGFIRFRIRELLRLPTDGLDPLTVDYRNYKPPLRRLLAGYRREDVAWTFQHILEREVVRLARTHAPGGPFDLVLAGGVFANVKLNMALSEELEPESIYIFPAMGDGGLCVGAALSLQCTRPRPIPNMYLGTGYGEDELAAAQGEYSDIAVERPDDPERRIAELLAEGSIVARFDGRMEFGPRALGNRSILYHCGDPSVNTWLNRKLNRTEFMPFAPMCLYEDADEYFLLRDGERRACEFMTLVVRCTDLMKDTCAAAVHVDGTARPQLIREDINPGAYRILRHYRDLTGISCVINTSFNMHEEPIVRSPEEALRAFRQSGLQYLALGPFIVSERAPTAEPGVPAPVRTVEELSSRRRRSWRTGAGVSDPLTGSVGGEPG